MNRHPPFISRQGMLTVTSEVATTSKIFLNLWKHECHRVIADRFTNYQDKEWFEKALKQVVEEDFDHETASLMDAEPYFVDFMRDAPEPTGMKDLFIQYKFYRSELVYSSATLVAFWTNE